MSGAASRPTPSCVTGASPPTWVLPDSGEAGLLPDGSSARSLSRPVPDTWIQAPNVTQDAAGPSGSHRATAKVGALGRLGALASPSRKQRDLGRPAGPTQLPVQHPGEPGARLPLRSPARRAPLHRAGRQRPGVLGTLRHLRPWLWNGSHRRRSKRWNKPEESVYFAKAHRQEARSPVAGARPPRAPSAASCLFSRPVQRRRAQARTKEAMPAADLRGVGAGSGAAGWPDGPAALGAPPEAPAPPGLATPRRQ